jgi:mono/diheme cytochrome c family protein
MTEPRKRLLRMLAGAAIAIVVAVILFVVIDQRSDPFQGNATARTMSDPAQIARGRYIAVAGDCVACHTAPGGQSFAGGLALETPFGQIVSSNITSDPETGLGKWTAADFDRALRRGKGRHGNLYPAMPYTAYAKMTNADVADLWAYLQTVTPTTHSVEENQLPFPFSQRWLLSFWNLLLFDNKPFKPNPAQSAQVQRGAYLSEALAHCSMCHTPKNLLGGDSSAHLQGAVLQGWLAPDLTNNAHKGLGRWSEADIIEYLKTGTNARSVASGPMTEAVENSTQYLTNADLNSVAAYFKALPARTVTVPQPVPVTDAGFVEGKRVYEAVCAACHTATGQGVRRMIPTLAGNSAVQADNPASLLHIILKGGEGPMTATNPTAAGMPRFDWKLEDAQIANVLTYVRNAWGNAAPAVSTSSVATARKSLAAAPTLIMKPRS